MQLARRLVLRQSEPYPGPLRPACAQRIERPAFAQRAVQRPPPLGHVWETRLDRPAHGRQRIRQRAQIGRQQLFQPQPQLLGQPRRSAARTHGNQHRIAIENARRREIAQIGPVDDIHQQPRTAQADGIRLAHGGIIMGDESEPRAFVYAFLHVGDDPPACPPHQPRLGLGHIALAQHNHRLPGNRVEERQLLHQSRKSGTRSASAMLPGRIRSATTAKSLPSTMTSATKPREL